MHRFRIVLTCVVAAFALLATPSVAQATATTATADADVPVVADAAPVTRGQVTSLPADSPDTLAAVRGCPLPYLVTAYGPVGQCSVVSGSTGTAGLYSPITGVYNANTGPFAVYQARYYSWNNGTIRGYYSLQTAYGPGVWATQYSGSQGRWGTVNLITSRFYPSSGWMPVA